ncbi:uncharacterized protein LOC134761694 [Pongo abelii]|uniref:uncharacterized protein LOC134761694 n=1 Tax=Pongo abelii TaxID=9601 RepID=UPI0030074358
MASRALSLLEGTRGVTLGLARFHLLSYTKALPLLLSQELPWQPSQKAAKPTTPLHFWSEDLGDTEFHSDFYDDVKFLQGTHRWSLKSRLHFAPLLTSSRTHHGTHHESHIAMEITPLSPQTGISPFSKGDPQKRHSERGSSGLLLGPVSSGERKAGLRDICRMIYSNLLTLHVRQGPTELPKDLDWLMTELIPSSPYNLPGAHVPA